MSFPFAPDACRSCTCSEPSSRPHSCMFSVLIDLVFVFSQVYSHALLRCVSFSSSQRRSYARQRFAIIRIQRVWRTFTRVRKFKAVVHSVCKAAAVVRCAMARRWFVQTIRPAILKLQASFRRMIVRKAVAVVVISWLFDDVISHGF